MISPSREVAGVFVSNQDESADECEDRALRSPVGGKKLWDDNSPAARMFSKCQTTEIIERIGEESDLRARLVCARHKCRRIKSGARPPPVRAYGMVQS